MRETVGPFRIVKTIGEGGMGVVYEAEDTRLGRRVAVKMIRGAAEDPAARERLWREARTAAGVSHPNVCQVFDVGEEAGDLYVAMELLEGEPLSARLSRGPVPPPEAMPIALGVLSALDALHARGIVHRDLKPSNVFLTPHGVKLLDFGLALPVGPDSKGDLRLTMTGMVVGTPQYMAPEQWSREGEGPRSDLFALGAILFEMLAGRPAFAGRNAMEIFHAVAYEPSPALAGGGVEAIDRVLQRALAKKPADRYESAAAMALAVREAMAQAPSGPVAVVSSVTRLIVLPFRLLRADPDVDFLSLGLSDAITTSLSGLPSLVVRSSHAASKAGDGAPDLKALATEAGVDVVLVGTLLRAGSRVRVTAQLLEAPAGTVLWSETAQVDMGDLFALQDDLARKIVESLALPLSARDKSALQKNVPATPKAYELYLRANQVALVTDMLPEARDLYLGCLREDPRFAPAWARLGRAYRVMGKYGFGEAPEQYRRAEEAFKKALEIDPDLPLAHNLFTYYEIEEMGHAREAMVRLLRRAQARPADPDLFAGLVVACRFGGLLEASLSADRRARRLDPGIRTSVTYTHWMAGDYVRAMEAEDQDMRWMHLYALPMLGREGEALALVADLEGRRGRAGMPAEMLAAIRGSLERDPKRLLTATRAVLDSGFHDPEGLYFAARGFAHGGVPEDALALLDRVVRAGFHVPSTMVRDPWLDPVRGTPAFAALLRQAEEGRRASAAAFREAGGERLLGATP